LNPNRPDRHSPQTARAICRKATSIGVTMTERTATQLIGLLPRLRRYARVLTTRPDAADDLVADTLTRARRARHETPQQSPALSVMAIMHRLHRGRRVRGDRGGRANPERGAADPPAPIVELLCQLALDEREVLLLVAVERLSYDDVAALLDVPPATVIARLSRARANLRALMQPDDPAR
jgi:RNA polymerase sigma-70 factor (ECF subfamily)